MPYFRWTTKIQFQRNKCQLIKDFKFIGRVSTLATVHFNISTYLPLKLFAISLTINYFFINYYYSVFFRRHFRHAVFLIQCKCFFFNWRFWMCFSRLENGKLRLCSKCSGGMNILDGDVFLLQTLSL